MITRPGGRPWVLSGGFGQNLELMSAWIVEVEAGFPVQVVGLADPIALWGRPVPDAHCLRALEDGREVGGRNAERVMLSREVRLYRLEQQRRVVSELNRHEDALRLRWRQAEQVGDEAG